MSDLLKSFIETKLDLEDQSTGNNRLDTSTNFSPNSTGTPTDKANPGSPSRFYQRFTPTETYLQLTKNISGKSELLNLGRNQIDPVTEQPRSPYTIFDSTNLDTEKSGVDGGIPYKQDKDPTVYPVTAQSKSSIQGFFPVKGEAASKFTQTFGPKNTYLDFVKKNT
jgi:hypothetical protein